MGIVPPTRLTWLLPVVVMKTGLSTVVWPPTVAELQLPRGGW